MVCSLYMSKNAIFCLICPNKSWFSPKLATKLTGTQYPSSLHWTPVSLTISLIHLPNLNYFQGSLLADRFLAWLAEVGRGSWLLWLLPRCEIFCEARGDRRSFLPFVFSKRDASPVRRLPPMRAEQQRPASHRRSSPKNHRQQSAHVIMRLRMGSSPWSRLTALVNYGSPFIYNIYRFANPW